MCGFFPFIFHLGTFCSHFSNFLQNEKELIRIPHFPGALTCSHEIEICLNFSLFAFIKWMQTVRASLLFMSILCKRELKSRLHRVAKTTNMPVFCPLHKTLRHPRIRAVKFLSAWPTFLSYFFFLPHSMSDKLFHYSVHISNHCRAKPSAKCIKMWKCNCCCFCARKTWQLLAEELARRICRLPHPPRCWEWGDPVKSGCDVPVWLVPGGRCAFSKNCTKIKGGHRDTHTCCLVAQMSANQE